MPDEPLIKRIRNQLPHLTEEQGRDLAVVVQRLVAAFQPDRVFVFGSQARGEATSDSDLDMLIVVSTADEASYRLAQRAYRIAWPHSLPLDILIMARDEFEWRSRALSSLPATVLREGCLLYAA